MSTSKHTPGPWFRPTPYATHIVTQGMRMVADAPHSHWMTAKEGFANADLIAAAPDMLSMLEKCELFLNQTFGGRALQLEVQAVIKKAKGEA